MVTAAAVTLIELATEESVLRLNLFTLRTVIDEYTYDKQKAPQSLDDLVQAGYLRQVPVDSIVGNNRSWKLVHDLWSAVSALGH